MDINRLARIVALCLSGIVLTACRGTQGMDIQAIAYNKAVADSTNQLFLLNTLRARDRFPLYYSRTTGNTASASLSPSLTLGLDGNNLSPSATIGNSLQNNLSLANLDDQKFMRGVLTPVPLAIMEAYYGQRWPKEVLAMMFIKDITIDRGLVGVLINKFNKKCADRAAPYCPDRLPQSAQATLPDELAGCLSGGAVEFSGKDAVFDNYPPDPKALKCFQSLLRVLLALGLAPDDGPKYSVVIPSLPASQATDLKSLSAAVAAKLSVSKLGDGDDYAVCSMRGVSGFTLDHDALTKDGTVPGILSRVSTNAVSKTGQDGGLRVEGAAAPQGSTSLIASLPKNCAAQVAANNAEKLRAARCAMPANQQNDECRDPPDFNITTRSLDSMLYYLGEDLRAGGNVKIWADHGPGRYVESSLYVVKSTAQSRASDALVSVDYRDETYAIDSCPQGSDDPCLGRSLQVLSMLNQIWGLQKEATDTPSVPVVSIVNDH